jgi:cysteine desulfurase / selenocysteine lyase
MNPNNLRQQFPIFNNHPNMIYFDNAATTQKPETVLKAMENFYTQNNFNVHRSVYNDSDITTNLFENSRQLVADFINTQAHNIVFSSGTTDSINLIANGYYAHTIQAGDEIVVSIAEHHSNLLPWQNIARKTGAILRYIPLNKDATMDLIEAQQIINSKTKLVAITAVSNVLGHLNPLRKLTNLAHQVGADILVDAAQAAPEIPLDVQKTPVDWLAFSGHKMLAPTGIGVLYGRNELLNQIKPPRVGGEMIETVTQHNYKTKAIPYRLEAGTPNIAGAIGLGAAIKYLDQLSMPAVQQLCAHLGQYLSDKLRSIPDVTVYGPQVRDTGIVAFNVANIPPHDAATYFDAHHIDIRAGQHCAEPLVHALNTNATLRASLYIYNTEAECDCFVSTVREMKDFFNGLK